VRASKKKQCDSRQAAVNLFMAISCRSKATPHTPFCKAVSQRTLQAFSIHASQGCTSCAASCIHNQYHWRRPEAQVARVGAEVEELQVAIVVAGQQAALVLVESVAEGHAPGIPYLPTRSAGRHQRDVVRSTAREVDGHLEEPRLQCTSSAVEGSKAATGEPACLVSQTRTAPSRPQVASLASPHPFFCAAAQWPLGLGLGPRVRVKG